MKIFKILFIFLILLDSILCQTTYHWTGSVNSNFSTAGNWNPTRQIGLISDILIFDKGGTLYVDNIYQVTVGQLLILNNTNLTLVPNSGNSKTISIQGGTGEDLIIENNSSLRILGDDPNLNIYLKTGATASIFGTLILSGNIPHSINTYDSLSFRFKNGSILKQECPGNVFSTTGINNSVVFEYGSSFIINHPLALNPFGLTTPNSKVIFENGSNFTVHSFSQNILTFNGRTYPNLKIETGIYNITENFSSNINIGNIEILQTASLIFRNTSSKKSPVFNITGNIIINGIFGFSEKPTNSFNVKMNGLDTQHISGTGEINFPKNLSIINISNTISLHRNLTIYCSVLLTDSEIITNNFNLDIKGKFKIITHNDMTIQNSNNDFSKHDNSNILKAFYISQNYPNPFNPVSKIDYALPYKAKISIKIYDISGKEVKTLVDAIKEEGYYSEIFDGTNLSNGTYFYTILAEGNEQKYMKTMKMILVK